MNSMLLVQNKTIKKISSKYNMENQNFMQQEEGKVQDLDSDPKDLLVERVYKELKDSFEKEKLKRMKKLESELQKWSALTKQMSGNRLLRDEEELRSSKERVE
mmetsp:Transcript_2275/g.2214  ORF Transcript_2275/g.2214 Transcript_2275/m.2214 type:complete len:103 (-) Transcript_2275:366-674(-)